MSSRAARRWLPAVLVLVVAACGGAPRPPAQPPPETRTVEPTPGVAPEPAEAPQPQPAPPPAAVPRSAPTEVVIEPADPEPDEKPTLAEAAALERERRRRAGEPFVVINDANLAEHAVGELTFMEDEPAAPESAGDGADADADGRGEQYWRDRVRAIRLRWAEAAGQVPDLEERVAELRRRFYETDDAYYRDTRIKPAWDRAIDLIGQTRGEAEAHRLELEAVLEEGRRAGALPGWLREGIELEPAPEAPEDDTHEPSGPVVVEPEELGDGP